MQRDAEATRQRLIEAGRAEFAAHGLAGARVDRIAEAARSNKAQIYHYFKSKAGLFEAVWNSAVGEIIGGLPFDVEDLPGVAARLSDIYAEHPDLPRLITWQNLERAGQPLSGLGVEEVRRRSAALADAQARGVVSDRFDPRVLFAVIVHTAMLWPATAPELLAVVDLDDPGKRREIVRQVVTALID
ncbi:TetR family transcriptional regulator [Kitasatospora sp. NPDC089797]|uniref:TetR family transcriptional regulator n=1 Tax=Kitasatospora sp. NPDC089797 TaxID=3155298 RepID=UPI003425A253